MKKIMIAAIAAALSFACVGQALAWGRVGHRTIAEIAERHLTPAAKAEIERYTGGESIVAYAVFMDSVVKMPEYVKPFRGWHASIADEKCKSPLDVRFKHRKCHDGVTAMEDFRASLANRSEMTDSAVLCAIKCIVHIVGDFHCPAHVRYTDCKNEGKYKVTYYDRKAILHSVWDTGVITHGDRRKWTYGQYADYLDTWSDKKIAACTKGWAQEWFEDCAHDVRKSIHWVGEGDVLGDKFQKKALPLAELELRKAGYQLAKALNTIFGNEEK